MTTECKYIVARFTGANGSLGLVRGRMYKLEAKFNYASAFEKFFRRLIGDPVFAVVIRIVAKDGYKSAWRCPYSSYAGFHANWRVDEPNRFFANACR